MMSSKRVTQNIHFIGIGGIGMSALARFFVRTMSVSGSDATASVITKSVVKDRIRVSIGHKGTNIPPRTVVVIASQAVKEENPEMKEAHRRGIPVVRYPEAVGKITKHYQLVAIAGSHGKSTTTALSALTLIKGGLDPTVIVGTNLKEFKGKNFRQGKSGYFVLEADEYGKAFLNYSPTVAIVTNIDREHLDTYKNLAGVKKAFLQFLSNIKDGGMCILNRDDKNLYSLRGSIAKLAKKKDLTVIWYSLHDPATKKIKKIIKIFGTHNVSNASAVFALGRTLKIPEKKILGAIASYRGAWRRMEYRGVLGGKKTGPMVFDDYAHHPSEIRATLAAFKDQYPKKQIICVFQPHQAKRLESLFNEFRDAFKGADTTVLLPIYAVTGRDKGEKVAQRGSEALARAMYKKFPKKHLFYLKHSKDLKPLLEEVSLPSSIIIMMGAGDIVDLTDKLVS